MINLSGDEMEVAIKILSALFIAIITSYITVRLSIHRFYEEKWWEKKQELYSNLFEALHHLKNYATDHREEEMMRGHLKDEKKKELSIKREKYSQELAKIHDIASLHLSKKAVSIIDEYKKYNKEALKADTYFEFLDEDLWALNTCMDALKIEAKKDLKIKGRFW